MELAAERIETMKLVDAIKHAKATAEKNKDNKCGKEHLQLASWLEELLKLRKENKKLKNKLDMDCVDCKHDHDGVMFDACETCRDFSNWEPVTSEE